MKKIAEGETFKIIVESALICKNEGGKSTAKHVHNYLKGAGADIRQYFNEKGDLNELGYRAVTEILIQALNTNIQGAHQFEIIDSAKHLRHVISRLEELFVNVVTVIQVPVNSVGIDD